jgi:beta-galactosidase
VTDAALVFDYDCSWALAIQPGHFRLAYLDQIVSWYGSHLGQPLRNRCDRAEIDLSAYKIVFAPVAYVMSEKQAARIRSFVQGGGMFVTNFRLGVKTETSQIVRTPLPGLLRDVMGATVEDYIPVYSAKNGMKFSPALAGPDSECVLWTDILQPREPRCWRRTRWVHMPASRRSP